MHVLPNDVQMVNPDKQNKMQVSQQQQHQQMVNQQMQHAYDAMNWSTAKVDEEVADEAQDDEFENLDGDLANQ